MGPEEEAIVQIGWVPSNGTPLREVILAKFGKHHAQIKLIATCKAPMDKVKVQADTVIQADFLTPIITTVKSSNINVLIFQIRRKHLILGLLFGWQILV